MLFALLSAALAVTFGNWIRDTPMLARFGDTHPQKSVLPKVYDLSWTRTTAAHSLDQLLRYRTRKRWRNSVADLPCAMPLRFVQAKPVGEPM